MTLSQISQLNLKDSGFEFEKLTDQDGILKVKCKDTCFTISSAQLIPIESKKIIIFFGLTNESTLDSESKPQEQNSEKPKKKFTFKVGAGKSAKPQKQSQLIVFDQSKQSCQIMKIEGKEPTSRTRPVVTVLGEKIFLFGGKTQTKELNDLHCLDTETWSWKKLFCMEGPPPGRSDRDFLTPISQTKLLLVSTEDFWILQTKQVKWQLKTVELPGGVWNKCSKTVQAIQSLISDSKLIALNPLKFWSQKRIAMGYYCQQQNSLFFVVLNEELELLCKCHVSLKSWLKQPSEISSWNFLELSSITNKDSFINRFYIKHGKQTALLEIRGSKADQWESFISKSDPIDHQEESLYCTMPQQGLIFELSSATSILKKSTLVEQAPVPNIKIQQIQQTASPSTKVRNKVLHSSIAQSAIHSIAEESNESSIANLNGGASEKKLTDDFEFDRSESYIEQHSNENAHYSQGIRTTHSKVERDFNMVFNENSGSEVERQFDSSSQHSRDSKPELRILDSERRESKSIDSGSERARNNRFTVKDSDSPRINRHLEVKQQHNMSFPLFSKKDDQKVNISNKANRSRASRNDEESTNSKVHENQSDLHEKLIQSNLRRLWQLETQKRQKLEQRSAVLEKAIKDSERLSKLLTRFSQLKQKHQHIKTVKGFKDELEQIWSKESFYRQQIQISQQSNIL